MMTTAILDESMPAETYHQKVLGVASNSGLKQVRRSAAHYRSWIETEQEPTPAMEFGSLAHLYVFELGKCLQKVAIAPDFGDCRKTLNKEAKAAWHSENNGKMIVAQDAWDKVRAIGEAVHRHPIAEKLIAQAKAEISIFWQDAETGLDCKARVDGWCPTLRIVLDLKTTTDASPAAFAKAIGNFDYHAQAAFYMQGLSVAAEPPKAFVFVAIEKEPPYAVATYTLDDAALARGAELIARDMATLRRCVDADEWPAYGTATQTLSLPPWNLRD